MSGPARGRRLPAADLLRAVAVVGVVCIHAAHWPSTASALSTGVWNDVKLASRFCVPVFVVLTGLLLAYGRTADRGAAVRFLSRRARRSLLPWLAWAPVYFITGWLVTSDIEHTAFGAGDWWAGGAGHLYFLLLVPQLYLVYLVWPRGRGGQLLAAAAAMAVQVGLDVARLAGHLGGAASDVAVWHGYMVFPFWIGYFAVGVAAGGLLAGRGAPDRPRLALAALVAVPPLTVVLLVAPGGGTFADGTGAFLRPLLIPVVLATCAAVLLGGGRLMERAPALRWVATALSADALGIYIVQALVMYVPGRALFPLLQADGVGAQVAGFVLLAAGTLVLSALVARLLARGPLAWTVGAARTRPGAAAPVARPQPGLPRPAMTTPGARVPAREHGARP